MFVPWIVAAATCKAVRPSGPEKDAGDGVPSCEGRRSDWTICSESIEAAKYSGEKPLSVAREASSGASFISRSTTMVWPCLTASYKAVAPLRFLARRVVSATTPPRSLSNRQAATSLLPAFAAQCSGVSRHLLRVATSEGALSQMSAASSAWPRLAARCNAVFPLLVTPRRQLVPADAAGGGGGTTPGAAAALRPVPPRPGRLSPPDHLFVALLFAATLPNRPCRRR